MSSLPPPFPLPPYISLSLYTLPSSLPPYTFFCSFSPFSPVSYSFFFSSLLLFLFISFILSSIFFLLYSPCNSNFLLTNVIVLHNPLLICYDLFNTSTLQPFSLYFSTLLSPLSNALFSLRFHLAIFLIHLFPLLFIRYLPPMPRSSSPFPLSRFHCWPFLSEHLNSTPHTSHTTSMPLLTTSMPPSRLPQFPDQHGDGPGLRYRGLHEDALRRRGPVPLPARHAGGDRGRPLRPGAPNPLQHPEWGRLRRLPGQFVLARQYNELGGVSIRNKEVVNK